MNENIKHLIQLMDEHPDLPVIPMVGQDIVADSFGEWTAEVGEAEIRKLCIYEDAVIFYDENTLKTAGLLELDYETLGIPEKETEKVMYLRHSIEGIEVLIKTKEILERYSNDNYQ